MAGTADLVSRSGQPLVASFTDVVLLIGLAAVTGIYVILARSGSKTPSDSREDPPAH
jgi:hypothetical protein